MGYSKTDTVTEDADIDDLVDLFKGLRKDMRDQKAETARLNRVLRQEQEERMRLNSSHKEETVRLNEETVRLNRSLRQEQKERKEETARLNRSLLLEGELRHTATMRQLTAAITIN